MINPDDYPDEDDTSLAIVERARDRVAAGQVRPEWMSGLPVTESGGLRKTTGTLIEVLERHPALAGRIKYNARKNTLVAVADMPWRPAGQIDDPWLTELQAWLEGQVHVQWADTAVYRAVQAVAHRRQYDPVADYLRRLEWDGQLRVSDLLIRLGGAEDTPLIRAMTRCWMISAVQRALHPGCQVDHVLILEGKQETKKTSFFREMATMEYFGEGQPQLDSKAGSESLQGPWIYELGEMGVLSRHDSEIIKQYITCRIDRYRAAYDRVVSDHPRRVVFGGSTNDARYLRDPTGGRRWWPVQVSGIDIDKLLAERDQLWAEAVVAAKAGEPHWLRGPLKEDAGRAQEERLIIDPWEDEIACHIASRELEGGPMVRLSAADVWTILEVPIERRGGQTGQRVAAIMRRLGWIPTRSAGGRGFARDP